MSSTPPLTKSKGVPPDEMEQLLAETNFTAREIEQFYKHASREYLTKQEFAQLCFELDICIPSLVERMWSVFDANHDGKLTHFELVKSLNPLLRGNRDDVASLFFDLYEIDGDGELSAAEIISVYSDMLAVNEHDELRTLSSDEKKRIRDWVDEQRGKDGKLDKDVFLEAIRLMDEEAGGRQKAPFFTWRTAYYVFLTAWFEMGTSFSLPAMGALSERMKSRLDITDQEIGVLTSAYFFAAMVGPLVGGLFMDKYGPGPVLIGANIIVTIGASFQAIANRPDLFWLILIGRLLLGFGGEITPFATVETLGRLFPDYFGLMAGIRNLIQSTSTFLAFTLLPLWADAASDYELDNHGTTVSLWICAVLGGVSLVASIIVYISMEKEKASVEEVSDQATITKVMRGLAKATTPRMVGFQKWKLPCSFFFAVYGIKAQYFAPFGFTAFSNVIYYNKFGQSREQASLLSGIISLIAGLLGPFFGYFSDWFGRRSLSLAAACLLSLVGFAILALSSGGSAPAWVASMLFAIQYGFGDTVAYLSIRLIVGVSRAGVGYGVYGIFGNLIATIVPIIGGALMEKDNGYNKTLWYFCGLMAFGAICWVAVFFLEGPRSLLELPAEKVIETADRDIQMAALTSVVGGDPIKTLTVDSKESDKIDVPSGDKDEVPPMEQALPEIAKGS